MGGIQAGASQCVCGQCVGSVWAVCGQCVAGPAGAGVCSGTNCVVVAWAVVLIMAWLRTQTALGAGLDQSGSVGVARRHGWCCREDWSAG